MTTTITPVRDSAPPVSNSLLLALIHVQADLAGPVREVGWVEHVRRVEGGRVHVHSVIRIEAETAQAAEDISVRLFGHTHRVGHWRLNHPGVPDESVRDVTVKIVEGPR